MRGNRVAKEVIRGMVQSMNSSIQHVNVFILSDLGSIRILEVQHAGDDPAERTHLREIRNRPLQEPIKSPGAVSSDVPGKFARGSSVSQADAMSYAENPNLEGELEKRAIGQLADEIGSALAAMDSPRCVFVAPQTILPRVMDALGSHQKAIVETVGANLVKTPIADLQKRFVK